jgi:hypothetical protein
MPVPPQLQPWMNVVNEVKKSNPELEYKKVLMLAKKLYKPIKKPTLAKKPKRATKATTQKYYANGRPYKTGRGWMMDRYMHNANEPWEIPRKKRKLPVWN